MLLVVLDCCTGMLYQVLFLQHSSSTMIIMIRARALHPEGESTMMMMMLSGTKAAMSRGHWRSGQMESIRRSGSMWVTVS